MDFTEGYDNESVIFKSCQFCRRTFHPESLERHERVCEKSKYKQRKVFNSFQQRSREIGIAQVKSEKKEGKHKSKWKEQHEELLRTIRSEKLTADVSAINNAGYSPRKSIPIGYIQCPFCGRCFNHKAADRHISWCEEQQFRMPKTPPSSEALQRLKARIQYRAPLPGKKKMFPAEAQRLVKSADSCKSPSVHRTHSSPAPLNDSFSQNIITRRRSCERIPLNREYNNIEQRNKKVPLKNTNVNQSWESAAVKFKEKFPSYKNQNRKADVYTLPRTDECSSNFSQNRKRSPSAKKNNERNGNVDILNVLKLQLAELEVSERKKSGLKNRRNDSYLPVMYDSETPSSVAKACDPVFYDEDAHFYLRSDSSNSYSEFLPSLNCDSGVEKRMPRFCYQCGTKYPIMSAKFCCECGTKRLVFVANDNFNQT